MLQPKEIQPVADVPAPCRSRKSSPKPPSRASSKDFSEPTSSTERVKVTPRSRSQSAKGRSSSAPLTSKVPETVTALPEPVTKNDASELLSNGKKDKGAESPAEDSESCMQKVIKMGEQLAKEKNQDGAKRGKKRKAPDDEPKTEVVKERKNPAREPQKPVDTAFKSGPISYPCSSL